VQAEVAPRILRARSRWPSVDDGDLDRDPAEVYRFGAQGDLAHDLGPSGRSASCLACVANAAITALVNGPSSFLGDYAGTAIAGARRFTLANWPEARQWTDSHSRALAGLVGDIEAAIGDVSAEWLAVAAWLASTRHPADEVRQRRVLIGHLIGRAVDMPAGTAWRARFRDTRHLLGTVQAILDQRMPLDQD
jgi:hypothetical protein